MNIKVIDDKESFNMSDFEIIERFMGVQTLRTLSFPKILK